MPCGGRLPSRSDVGGGTLSSSLRTPSVPASTGAAAVCVRSMLQMLGLVPKLLFPDLASSLLTAAILPRRNVVDVVFGFGF